MTSWAALRSVLVAGLVVTGTAAGLALGAHAAAVPDRAAARLLTPTLALVVAAAGLLAALLLRLEARARRRLRALEEEVATAASALRASETRARTYEWRLRQAQRVEALGRLAGGVAHDFNNLLSVVCSNVELALRDLPADHPLRPHLADIGEAGERGAALTRRLLAFGRGREDEAARAVGVGVLLQGMRRLFDRVLGEHIRLRIDCPDGLPAVLGFAGQIEQVLLNLVTNARDALPRGGSIAIRAEAAAAEELPEPAPAGGTWVRLTVQDDGSGMSPEVRARLFEPFYTTKPRDKGTGLGLPTVHDIVQRHGGQIAIGTEPGKGSRFDVFLPAVAAEPAQAAAHEEEPLPGGSETVVLVEDEPTVRFAVLRVLERLGYEVLVAHDSAEGLELLRGRAADLLLTDVVMPGMNGPDLALQALELRPQLRILYMSGYPGVVSETEEILGEGVELLSKPFTPEGLARRVRRILGEPRAGA